ncbi:MAG: hypothetical protein M1834_008982 [Cirrosporium novae-zelandiae]|nr:MAG: hypothetical protein M1834_008982 [Cirrosporium novae-zelandiae]
MKVSSTPPPDGYSFQPGQIIWPSLQVGAAAGAAGFFVGGFFGVLRSKVPVLFAFGSSFQWFALGSTFWATRSAILQSDPNHEITPSDRVAASTIAGGVSGAGMGALLRGRQNIIPGAIMFTLFGYLGQKGYNHLDVRHTIAVRSKAEDEGTAKSFLMRLGESKWVPFKVLTDEEYEETLQEKLLRIDTEIALIDSEISNLRNETKNQESKPEQGSS